MSEQETSKSNLLRALPSVDSLLRTETARALRASVGAQHLTQLARAVIDELRARVQKDGSAEMANGDAQARETLLAEAARRLERACLRAGFGGHGSDSLQESAATSVHLALAPELGTLTAGYYARKTLGRMHPLASEKTITGRFYEHSCRLTGLTPLSLPRAA